jgi:hypothetical protein
MAREIANLRPGIIGVLRLLASPEDQVNYERRVAGISVPTELLSQWFDDLYLPKSESFRSCFSAQEMEALSVFNNYFDVAEKRLPQPRDGIRTWLENETWQGIMREAARALSALKSESASQK